MRPHGLMLHHFKGGHHPDGQGAITANVLADIIEFMGPRNILSPQVWMEKAASKRLEPNDRCITLDDALLCQYDIAAPVLESYGLTAFWFVYSSVFERNIERLELYRYFRSVRFDHIDDFYKIFFEHLENSSYRQIYLDGIEGFKPDEYLSGFHFYTDIDRKFRYVRDKVLGPKRYQELMDSLMQADAGFSIEDAAKSLWMCDQNLVDLDQKGHVIGLHSYNHPTVMSDLTRSQQYDQFSKNFLHLRRVLGKAPTAMSHPCNSYNIDTLSVLDDLGVEIGFRANLNSPTDARFEHPRDDHAHVIQRMGL